MKSNRRSVLIGLGALTVGGGAVFGTGAFSSVEAERSVDISTAGDGEALLGLSIESDELDGGEDTISFDSEDLNEDAVTIFDDAFEVSNNRDDNDGGAIEVDIYDGSTADENSIVVADRDSTETGMNFVGDPSDIDPDNSVTLDIVFDLEGADDGDIPGEITFEALDNN